MNLAKVRMKKVKAHDGKAPAGKENRPGDLLLLSSLFNHPGGISP